MKRIIKYISLFIILISVIANSCKKDSENISKVTTFDILTLKGDSVVVLSVGQSYIDSGAISSGTHPVTETNNININTVGTYSEIYTTVNNDGFQTQINRTVYVVSAIGTDLSGTYTGYWYGYESGSVTISKISNGLYYGSDLLAGAYIPTVVPFYMYYNTVHTLSLLYAPQGVTTSGTFSVNAGTITYTVVYTANGQVVASYKLVKN